MSDSMVEKRLEVCSKCDKQLIKFTTRICGVCGCMLSVKAAIKVFNCPLDKWDKEEEKNG